MIQELRGVTYNWIGADSIPEDGSLSRSLSEAHELRHYLQSLTLDSSLRHVGLLAQDVQRVLPEAVEPIHEGRFLGVKYSEIVPVLVEAIKTLDVTVEQMQEKLLQQHGRRVSETETGAASCEDMLSAVESLTTRVRDLENRNRQLRAELTLKPASDSNQLESN